MTECKTAQEILLNLKDASVDLQALQQATNHAAMCPHCRAAMEDYRNILAALSPVDPLPPAGGWDAFEERLMAGGKPARRIAPWIMRAAAVIAIGLFGYQMARWTNQMSQPTTPASPPIASTAIPSSEASMQFKAFSEVSRAFDQQASWMLTAGNQSDIGVSEGPVVGQNQRVLLLRLIASKDGKVVSSADLAIVAGRSANVSLPLEGGKVLHYQIGTTDASPTRLSIWAELSRKGDAPEPLAAISTNLNLDPGKQASAGEMVTDSSTYQIRVGFAQAPFNTGDNREQR